MTRQPPGPCHYPEYENSCQIMSPGIEFSELHHPSTYICTTPPTYAICMAEINEEKKPRIEIDKA